MPNLAKKKVFTTQYYDDYHKGKKEFVQPGMRPTSAHRSNNPHPQSVGHYILMPHSISIFLNIPIFCIFIAILFVL